MRSWSEGRGGRRERGRELHAVASAAPPPPPIFKTGSLNRSRESESASERERGASSSLQEKRGKAPPPPPPPPPPLPPPMPSIRAPSPSPPEKQVSLFHFLAAGEPNQRTKERRNCRAAPPIVRRYEGAKHERQRRRRRDAVWTRRPPSDSGPLASPIRLAHLSRRSISCPDARARALLHILGVCGDQIRSTASTVGLSW